MLEPKANDRRRHPRHHPRIDSVLSAHVTWQDGQDRVPALASDISQYGVFLRLNAPVARGTTVAVRLTNPCDASALDISGGVIHTVRNGRAGKGFFGVGIEFLAGSQELKQLVNDLRAASAQAGASHA